MGDWMLALWVFLCGPPNVVSLNYIATLMDRAYEAVYRMMHDIMRKVSELPEGRLSGPARSTRVYPGRLQRGGAGQQRREPDHP